MANKEHVAKLFPGFVARPWDDLVWQSYLSWNEWRLQNADIVPDLRGADLRNVMSAEPIDLSHCLLAGADLSGVWMPYANFRHADLRVANLRGAHLNGASLFDANLRGADLSGAKLSTADLSNARLVETNLENADISDCSVYGVSVWKANLVGITQHNLTITSPLEPTIKVDDLEVAQLLYLLLNNEKLSTIIEAVTSKAVLILGRFTTDRMAVLKAMQAELRKHGYIPILFDFNPPVNRTMTETVTTLARLARFIIADVSAPRSVPQELEAIVRQLTSVPVKPIIQTGERPWGGFASLAPYPWLLELYEYDNVGALLQSFDSAVIKPAEMKLLELKVA